MSNSYIKLKVAGITCETEDAVTLHLQHPDGVAIPSLPGQFLTLILTLNGQKVRRSYSLSSCSFEGPNLSVTVKRIVGGLVSNYLVNNTRVGDMLEALPPIGSFTIKTSAANSRHIVLFGAGSGITPLMSMLKAVLQEEPASKLYLIYGNRNENNIIFKDQLTALQQKYPANLQVIHVLSQPNDPGAYEYSGRLNRSTLLKLLGKLGVANYADTLYFTCGPEGMMDEVKEALKILRVPQERIFKESFVSNKITEEDSHGDVTIANDSPSGPQEVTVLYEGTEYKFTVQPKQTILDAALDQDIDLPYSCQSGLCTACRGKCLSGKVHLDESDGLSDAELKEGYVLTCVGHPVTRDVVIEID